MYVENIYDCADLTDWIVTEVLSGCIIVLWRTQIDLSCASLNLVSLAMSIQMLLVTDGHTDRGP